MGLYDIMDEISRQQVLKTDTGDSRMYGVAVGIVTNNYNQDMPGRVCVNIPVRDQEASELKWARMAFSSGGDGWGHYFIPEVGDQVLVAFEQGNFEKPYIIGNILRDESAFLAESADEKNQRKRIVTKNGTRIVFEDNAEGDNPGQKDKLTIATAGDAYSLLMDNENKAVTLKDAEGKNQFCIRTETGEMEVTAEKKLIIRVGNDIAISCDGESGAVELKAKSVTISSDGELKIKGKDVGLSGSSVDVNGSSGLTLGSSANVSVSGQVVNLG